MNIVSPFECRRRLVERTCGRVDPVHDWRYGGLRSAALACRVLHARPRNTCKDGVATRARGWHFDGTGAGYLDAIVKHNRVAQSPSDVALLVDEALIALDEAPITLDEAPITLDELPDYLAATPWAEMELDRRAERRPPRGAAGGLGACHRYR